MREGSAPKWVPPTTQSCQAKTLTPLQFRPGAPHLSRALYSSSETASLGNSGASVGPHSGDS